MLGDEYPECNWCDLVYADQFVTCNNCLSLCATISVTESASSTKRARSSLSASSDGLRPSWTWLLVAASIGVGAVVLPGDSPPSSRRRRRNSGLVHRPTSPSRRQPSCWT